MKLFLKILFKEPYHLLRKKYSREFLRLALLHGDTPRYQKRKINFLQYQIQVPDCFSFLWQFKEIFADQAYRFATSNPKPVIFDCGANVGTSCLYFKHIYPQASIKAFEADPHIAQLLSHNIQFNHLKGVEVVAKAVWTDNNGIYISHEGADGASVFGEGEKIYTPSIRLKEALLAEKHIDMLKIDIEGAEVAVLEDCKDSLYHVGHIFIEYHAYLGQSQQLDKILSILTQNHFRYFIRDAQDRESPFISHFYKNTPIMDLQLNIFAYKTD